MAQIYFDSNYAPVGFLIVRENCSPYDDVNTHLVQSDWEYPLVASSCGYVACKECDRTDGTIDCAHHTASEMIAAAYDFMAALDGRSFTALDEYLPQQLFCTACQKQFPQYALREFGALKLCSAQCQLGFFTSHSIAEVEEVTGQPYLKICEPFPSVMLHRLIITCPEGQVGLLDVKGLLHAARLAARARRDGAHVSLLYRPLPAPGIPFRQFAETLIEKSPLSHCYIGIYTVEHKYALAIFTDLINMVDYYVTDTQDFVMAAKKRDRLAAELERLDVNVFVSAFEWESFLLVQQQTAKELNDAE